MSDASIKVLIVGGKNVGKKFIRSNLVMKGRSYSTEQDLTNENEFNWKQQQRVSLKLIELGLSKYEVVRDNLFRNSDAFICIFSVSDQESFESIQTIVEQIRRVKESNAPMVLVANKIDVPKSDWKVSIKKARAFAQDNQMKMILISTVLDQKVDQCLDWVLPQNAHQQNNHRNKCQIL